VNGTAEDGADGGALGIFTTVAAAGGAGCEDAMFGMEIGCMRGGQPPGQMNASEGPIERTPVPARTLSPDHENK